MRVLLTRARDAAERSARRLREAGHEPILFPLTRTRHFDFRLPPESFDGVIFTSARGVSALGARASDALAESSWLDALRLLPAWCVGEATASAARSCGFRDARLGEAGEANGDAESLASAIRSSMRSGRLFYPMARDSAFDMSAALEGFEICAVEAYAAEALPVDCLGFSRALRRAREGDGAIRAAGGGEAGAVGEVNRVSGGGSGSRAAGGGDAADGNAAALFYSARGARLFGERVEACGLSSLLSGLTLVAISERTASALPRGGEREVLVAERACESSMLDLLAAPAEGFRTQKGFRRKK